MATDVEVESLPTDMRRPMTEEVEEVERRAVKHPLRYNWSLWYFKQEKGRDWSESQHKISSFCTIEDFWCLHNHIQPPSLLATGCDYSLFKEGIQPMWEDERNKKGGRWILNVQNRRIVDPIWMETLFCLIGEAFEEFSEDICGAVVNIRNKCDKIGLWTRDCTRMDANMAIGKLLKARLNLGREATLEYQSHRESSSKSNSIQRSSYVI